MTTSRDRPMMIRFDLVSTKVVPVAEAAVEEPPSNPPQAEGILRPEWIRLRRTDRLYSRALTPLDRSRVKGRLRRAMRVHACAELLESEGK
jgi:hypothetical protein